jgi:excisionase family DNA binding protein
MTTSNHLLTTHEFAEALRISPKTVSGWIRAGKLKAVKVAGIIRIPREELDKLFA